MTSIVDHVHLAPASGLDARLARLLADWLPRQRWYGGKGARIDTETGVKVLARLDLLPDRDPGLAMIVVEVRPDGRDPERYQLFLGARRELPDRLAHVEIGSVADDRGADWRCYDALHDPELAGWLLERLAASEAIGPLRFHLLPGRRIDESLRSLVLTGEQSNTSVVYGDKLIAKFLRRAVSGVNPDLELSLALADSGSRNIPQPVGWIDLTLDLDALQPAARPAPSPRRTDPDQADAADDDENGRPRYGDYGGPEPITVAMVAEFLPTATDGWLLAQTSVRDLYAQPAGTSPKAAGGDFGPEARRLGKATARVHHDLATMLPTGRMEPEELERVAQGMIDHLHHAAGRVRELEPYVPALSRILEKMGRIDTPIPTQRVHGDFHLGQVMRTVNGWVLLDFEGEPSRSLEERRAMHPAVKDVAGMARSFDYAAHHLGGDPEAAQAWADRNFSSFCKGYAAINGHDPREQDTLLKCYEIDKAVYEAVYESANRPTWLHIPLGAIRRLAEGKGRTEGE
ncbi:MAG TPA: aminoglycoside phosphotransferase [Actinospica sp.]|jgi:maltokinase|nr:aminoglycoside phosphotransferase [Actinospica sp.]